jgi:hypothetical protein
MAFVADRRWALPLSVMPFLMLGLVAPPTMALLPILILGMALMAFTVTGGLSPRRICQSVVRIDSCGDRHTEPAVARVTIATSVRTAEAANGTTAEDALDLVRLDDDGGWQRRKRNRNEGPRLARRWRADELDRDAT